MRISGHVLGISLAAALLAAAGGAQDRSEPGTRTVSRPPVVNLRLSPDLGDALPRVRAALLGLGPARLAEPADFEITTKKDFPQTLIAFDAQQPQADWRNDFGADPVRPAPRTVELGNLVLDDFSGRLRELVKRRDRANRLLVLAMSSRPADVDTCLVTPGEPAENGNCLFDSIRAGATEQSLPDELDGEDLIVVNLHNRSTGLRYAALLVVDPASGIVRAPLSGAGDRVPLAPGAQINSEVLSLGYSSGFVVLVTITSDRPIDTTAVEQAAFDDAAWDDCLESNANCAKPLLEIPAEWAISLTEFHYHARTLVGIGGGLDVAEGMAPWMAEIYSTIPFSPKEIEDDAQAPQEKRKYLAQRSRAERDHRCGGTLVGANLVLTAAHCVANDPFSPGTMAKVLTDRRVRVGTKRLGKGGTTLAIAGVAIPSSYAPGRQDGDIALLLLRPDRDTKRYDDAVIGLGDKPIESGTEVTAFGWGYTGVVRPGANPLLNIAEELQRNPDQLQFGRMRALAWSACRRQLKTRLGTGMVCVVAPGAETGTVPDKNVFSCRGDSGGPLVREVGGIEELVGVTSWSLGCGYKDIPSVYTDVTKYRRWIAAAAQQLTPGAALRVDEKAAPSREEGRRQSSQ